MGPTTAAASAIGTGVHAGAPRPVEHLGELVEPTRGQGRTGSSLLGTQPAHGVTPDGAAGHEPAAAVVGGDVDLGAEPLERDAGAEQHPRPVDGLVEVGAGLVARVEVGEVEHRELDLHDVGPDVVEAARRGDHAAAAALPHLGVVHRLARHREPQRLDDERKAHRVAVGRGLRDHLVLVLHVGGVAVLAVEDHQLGGVGTQRRELGRASSRP